MATLTHRTSGRRITRPNGRKALARLAAELRTLATGAPLHPRKLRGALEAVDAVERRIAALYEDG